MSWAGALRFAVLVAACSLKIRRVEISVAGGKHIFFVKGGVHRAASDILIASPDFNEIF
jgi:hypothetical protein